MSKFKAEFTLKQHTPIIHFQSDQNGATLRATELKPKLDRFLIEKIFKKDKSQYEPFLIDKDKDALDYKVKIFPNPNQIKTDATYKTVVPSYDNSSKVGSYFGDSKAVGFEDKLVNIEIHCFNSKLKKIIEDNLEYFFCTTGFGTRSNKGFGSFSLQKTTEQSFEDILKRRNIVYYKLSDSEPLRKIHNEYQLIKSGNSRNKQKSYLMEYFFDKQLRWEKRWIKKQIKEKNPDMFKDLKDDYHDKNGFNPSSNEKYIFARALLGLADNHEYQTYSSSKKSQEAKAKKEEAKRESDRNKKNKLFDDATRLSKEADGLKVKISIRSNDNIARYKSPLNFRVFGKSIFIIIDETTDEIYDKEFTFVASYKNGNSKTELKTIKTPQKKDFNFCEFMEYAMKKPKNSSHSTYNKNQHGSENTKSEQSFSSLGDNFRVSERNRK